MRALVLLNRNAGTLAAMTEEDPLKRIAKALKAAGIEAEIQAIEAEKLVEVATQAASDRKFDIVIGGGDGTLSAIAGALAGTDMPFGILPLGTLNHFSKDLGIPQTIEDAALAIAQGIPTKIDVAEVNGRIFVNNSSLGLYPRMVLARDGQREKAGWSKWPAMCLAFFKMLQRFPLLMVKIETDDPTLGRETIIRKTPLVFIGNNEYSMELFKIGTRVALDKGQLCLYLADVSSRWGLFKLMLRAMFGRLVQSRDFLTYSLAGCRIESGRRRLHVAVDGEVIDLVPPLEYVIRAQALIVVVPRETAASVEATADTTIPMQEPARLQS